jgi:hypothetical protein
MGDGWKKLRLQRTKREMSSLVLWCVLYVCVCVRETPKAVKQLTALSSYHTCASLITFFLLLVPPFSDMNDNKHRVAFYFVLVILLATLRQCHSSKDAAEVISHYARDSPKSDIGVTSLQELRRSYADRSTTEKLAEIRRLLRSLVFDWSLDGGESALAGEFRLCFFFFFFFLTTFKLHSESISALRFPFYLCVS